MWNDWKNRLNFTYSSFLNYLSLLSLKIDGSIIWELLTSVALKHISIGVPIRSYFITGWCQILRKLRHFQWNGIQNRIYWHGNRNFNQSISFGNYLTRSHLKLKVLRYWKLITMCLTFILSYLLSLKFIHLFSKTSDLVNQFTILYL